MEKSAARFKVEAFPGGGPLFGGLADSSKNLEQGPLNLPGASK